MNKIFIRFSGMVVLLLILVTGIAQQLPTMNIDQLTDQQLIQYMQQAGLTGLSETELVAKAREKGLSDADIAKLRSRMSGLNGLALPAEVGKNPISNQDNARRKPITYLLPKAQPDSINGLLLFGSEIFSKENLTFEPNTNMATPKTYVLGPDDQLKIEIFGYSDKTQVLKVNPEGNIRYPNIGPIKVAGLTIDDAKVKLQTLLTRIYPGLKSGNTSLLLSINETRSIRVNLIGEITKPGTYSLSSLSTIANALYAAGGPTNIGSYRNIQLIRAGKLIAQFDLYDYLLKGDLSQNRLLQEEDVIRVPAYSSRVEVRGAVKRKAVYEIKEGDKLSTVLAYAGGLTDSANRSFVRILRFGTQQKEVLTIPAEQIASFALQSGDRIGIDRVVDNYKNRVIIMGAVSYPGAFSLDNVPTLKDLLSIAVPKEEAYKPRAILRRYTATDYSKEVIGFDVSEIVTGKRNINLMREDSVHIYYSRELVDTTKFIVDGEVNKPGDFGFVKGITLNDAIVIAGGYKDGAYKKEIEIARRVRDADLVSGDSIKYATILKFKIDAAESKNELNTPLAPFDIIYIRKSPGYREQMSVSVDGEVLYPGSYSINSNVERISDLIKRAGGIKDGAYVEGAFLLRKTYENLSSFDTIILKNKLMSLTAGYSDTAKFTQIDKVLKDNMKLVGIRLEKVLQEPGSEFDLALETGDIIKVPRKIETVQTFSGVYFPKKIVYRNGLTVNRVLRESGGIMPGYNRDKVYVVYANGEVKSAKRFLFFKSNPDILPGAEVYVPANKTRKSLSAAELTTITTGLVSLVTLFLTIRTITN